MTRYVKHEISNGKSKIGCPLTKCKKGEIKFKEVEELVDEELCLRFLQLTQDISVFLSKKHKWCPEPNCNTVCMVQTKSSASKTTCPKCQTEFCSKCDQNWTEHPAECTVNLIDQDTSVQACPGCQVLIQKKSGAGCLIIHCKICLTIFCWNCLAISKTGSHLKCTSGHVNWEQVQWMFSDILLAFSTSILAFYWFESKDTPNRLGPIQVESTEIVILGLSISPFTFNVAFLLQVFTYLYQARHHLFSYFAK